MTKNILNLRFGVSSPNGFGSSIWRLWASRKGDVYLADRSSAGRTKFSFHVSGICRSANTKEFSESAGIQNRLKCEWQRAKTPLSGDKVSRVARLTFPTDYLSSPLEKSAKKVRWLDAAPSEGATVIELVYTSNDERTIKNILSGENPRKLLLFKPLFDEESIAVFVSHQKWVNEDITSPQGEGSVFPDLIFSADDPGNTGRPIRLSMASLPKDGEHVEILELGGYEI